MTPADPTRPLPAVSVVLPTHNRLYCLPRAVESVLRQTYDDLELIVVDDCSTDGTLDYLRGIADPRLRVIAQEKNTGVSGARNTGIRAARAPLIAFQDSDDEWLVTKLARQMAVLAEAGDDHGVCYCGKVVHGRDDRGNFGGRLAAYMPDMRSATVSGDVFPQLLRTALASTQTLIIRRDLLEAVGGFDESLKIGVDWELTTRLARLTKFAFIEEPLVMTFLMGDSITHHRIRGVVTAERMIERHGDVLAKDPALLADKLFAIGRTYQRNGKWQSARPWLKRAIATRPGAVKAWMALALGAFRRDG